MSVEIRSLNHGLGMLQRQSGIYIESEDAEYIDRFYRDQAMVDKIRFNIIDGTQVNKTLISNEYAVEQARFCEQLAQTKPQNVVAVVCPDDVSFGMARMWLSYVDSLGWVANAFRDLAEAHEWVKQAYQEVYGEPLDEIIETGIVIPEINHSAN